VKSDEELKRAISESVRVRAKYVEIEIPGSAPSHLKPSAYKPAASSYPQQQQQQQQHQQQPHHAQAGASKPPPQQTHAPAKHDVPAPSGDSVLSFSIPGSGSGDKVKVNAQQESTRYLFVPVPSSHPTRIEVQIPTARQLQFTMVSNVAKLTQTFNLPFDISPSDLTQEGNNVVLRFPF